VVALIAFFNAHDSPTTTSANGGGPGQADATSSSAQLRAGNVLLQYSNPADAAPLRAVARAEAGTDTPDASLVAAGQAVIVARVPSAGGVTARAYRRTLHAPNGKDPAVEDFVSAYLGQGAQ
jgi:ABC-type sulfate transport system substrate-binding protein